MSAYFVNFEAAEADGQNIFKWSNVEAFLKAGDLRVWNSTSSQTIEINEWGMGFLDYSSKTVLEIGPSNVDEDQFEIVVRAYDNENSEFISTEEFNASGKGTIIQNGATTTLTLINADDYKFYIYFYPYGKAPKPSVPTYDEVNLTFNVTTNDGASTLDAYKYISIAYYATIDGVFQKVEKTLTSASDVVTVPDDIQVEVIPSGIYMVESISSTMPDITISDTGSVDSYYAFRIPEAPTWNEATINVVVSKTPTNVYVLFECKDTEFSGSAQDLVSVTYEPKNPTIENQDNGWRVFIAGESQQIVVTPIPNYGIANVTITNADGENVEEAQLLTTYGASCTETEGIYTISVSDASTGLVFLFDVEPTSVEGVDVTINFTGTGLEDDAFNYVSVIDAITPVMVDSNNFTYTYRYPESALNLYFVPAEGYLVNVSCKTADGIAYGEVLEDETRGVGAMALTIPVEDATDDSSLIPEGLVITVEVSADKTEAVSTIGSSIDNAEIYNLQGIKVNKNNITKGLYIINGKKVMIGK